MSITVPVNNKLIPLGTATKWGRIVGIGYRDERYYFIMNGSNTVSLIPAIVLETEYDLSILPTM